MKTRFLVLCAVLAVAVIGASPGPKENGKGRVKAPEFDASKVSNVFFDDVFAKLNGARPSKAAAGAGTPTSEVPLGGSAEGATSKEWESLISPSSLEDEIKALRPAIGKSVTTPGQFASRGHKSARREFALLNMLFWIVEHYSGEVRWKDDAKAARQQFGSVAGNAKAGGNEQTYAQAKRCVDMLDRLIRGEKLGVDPQEDDENGWEPVSPRRPLMKLLEDRFEADLKAWTSNEGEFKSNGEDLLREAELVAAIGHFFKEDGMEDADDEEYQKFCEQMKSAAQSVVQAVRQDDFSAAQQGVSKMSQACANCHDDYR